MNVRQPGTQFPASLIEFVLRHKATLTAATHYFSDSEATQYPCVNDVNDQQDNNGLTFKGRYGGLTNSDKVNRHEVVELIDILTTDKVALTSLLINGSYIDDVGAKSLANFIRTTDTLKVLDIHYSHVSEQGMQDLIDALKTNTSITHLNIRSNALTEILFNNLLELFEKYNHTVRQIGIVQRTSFPMSWKPSVEAEQQLHALIIKNAKAPTKKQSDLATLSTFRSSTVMDLTAEEDYRNAGGKCKK